MFVCLYFLCHGSDQCILYCVDWVRTAHRPLTALSRGMDARCCCCVAHICSRMRRFMVAAGCAGTGSHICRDLSAQACMTQAFWCSVHTPCNVPPGVRTCNVTRGAQHATYNITAGMLDSSLLVLGTPLLESYYVVFDRQEKQVPETSPRACCMAHVACCMAHCACCILLLPTVAFVARCML